VRWVLLLLGVIIRARRDGRPRIIRVTDPQSRRQHKLFRTIRGGRRGVFGGGASNKASDGCQNILDLFGGFRCFRHHRSLLDTQG
jgi:hypothetical protein